MNALATTWVNAIFRRAGSRRTHKYFAAISKSHITPVGLGFSETDRTENIRRIGEIAKLFCDAGTIALSSFISPYRGDRDEVRALHDAANLNFVEVHVDCALAEAEKRDPKGLYKKARAGEIKNFTGIDDPYEAPVKPEIHLHTDQMTLEEEVAIVIDYLVDNGIIKREYYTRSEDQSNAPTAVAS